MCHTELPHPLSFRFAWLIYAKCSQLSYEFASEFLSCNQKVVFEVYVMPQISLKELKVLIDQVFYLKSDIIPTIFSFLKKLSYYTAHFHISKMGGKIQSLVISNGQLKKGTKENSNSNQTSKSLWPHYSMYACSCQAQ